MDGWQKNRWMDGYMHACIDAGMGRNGYVDGARIDEWVDGQMDGGRIDGCMHGGGIDGWMVQEYMNGWMDEWMYG